MSEPTPNQSLVPLQSHRQALERKLTANILRLNPGLGEKSIAMANALADSGLSSSAALMLMRAVYSTSDQQGRGQATRMKWFVAMLENQFKHRLDLIRNDPRFLRSFISDIEELTDMRDTLNGEGYQFSFEAVTLLWKQGLSADTIMMAVQDSFDKSVPLSKASRMVIRAAMMVRDGKCLELETALSELTYGYHAQA